MTNKVLAEKTTEFLRDYASFLECRNTFSSRRIYKQVSAELVSRGEEALPELPTPDLRPCWEVWDEFIEHGTYMGVPVKAPAPVHSDRVS